MSDVLFRRSEGAWLPTELTIGPWSRDLQHGGALSALVVTLLEDAGGDGYTSVRLTMELVRPLRLVPLEVDAREVRSGRRLQVLASDVRAEGALIARATLMRIRPTEVTLPEGADPVDVPPRDAPEVFEEVPSWEPPSFLGSGVEVRVSDPERFMGADRGWFRLRVPVVEDGRPSPMTRVAAAADFGNGISALAPSFEALSGTFINSSLDVHLVREPEGDWVRLHARSEWRPHGIGLTRTELADRDGRVGVAHQTLVLS